MKSFSDHANGDDVALQLTPELIQVLQPRKCVQVFLFNGSTHDFGDKPDNPRERTTSCLNAYKTFCVFLTLYAAFCTREHTVVEMSLC